MLNALIASVEEKKAQLDQLRPLVEAALKQLQKHYDVELTYSSNAIEGNTLTLRETAEVIEHGITVGGKQLNEHLEAVDHYEALLWMREQAAATTPLAENIVTQLHRRIVARSRPDIAGMYSQFPRRIAGSAVVFPNPMKIPQLMEKFGIWLAQAPPDPASAFDAHFRLVTIHPFNDGNGRTARLLMNLMLIRGGYPPVSVRPEDRKAYLDALERGSLADDLLPFQILMHERLNSTLSEYIRVLREGIAPKNPNPTPNG